MEVSAFNFSLQPKMVNGRTVTVNFLPFMACFYMFFNPGRIFFVIEICI